MTARFGQSAWRLSGLAAQALGWRPDHFWSATPAELAAAVSPCAVALPAGLNRAELQNLLEQDHDR